MPEVHFVDPVTKEKTVKVMPVPKKGSKIEAWFRGARKVIPEIPETGNGQWYMTYQEATMDWVRFDLTHKSGKKKNVVILRHIGHLGAKQ